MNLFFESLLLDLELMKVTQGSVVDSIKSLPYIVEYSHASLSKVIDSLCILPYTTIFNFIYETYWLAKCDYVRYLDIKILFFLYVKLKGCSLVSQKLKKGSIDFNKKIVQARFVYNTISK